MFDPRRAAGTCLSQKKLHDKTCTPSGMGDVAHWFGSNIVDRGFTCTQYNVTMGALGEPAQIAIESVLLSDQRLFVGSDVPLEALSPLH